MTKQSIFFSFFLITITVNSHTQADNHQQARLRVFLAGSIEPLRQSIQAFKRDKALHQKAGYECPILKEQLAIAKMQLKHAQDTLKTLEDAVCYPPEQSPR